MITYQVSGKSTIVTEKPSIIINDLMMLKGFSKDDSTFIYNLAIEEKMCPSLKIASIIFQDMPVKFVIEDIYSKNIFQMTAAEIINSSSMIDNFSHTNLTMIYFQLMSEQERNSMARYRNLSKSHYNINISQNTLKICESE